MKIKTTSIIKQAENIPQVKLGEELSMLNIQTGKYYSMNNIGASIWSLTKDQISVAELIEKLMNQFDVDQEQCEKDVILFLNQLEQKELIKLMEA